MAITISRWLVAPDIDGPCADISISLHGRRDATITMHFSRTRGLAKKDLVLIFPMIYELNWEFDGPGNAPLPAPAPRFAEAEFLNWVFPTLEVHGDDEKLRLLEMTCHPKGRSLGRYALIAMNDIVHIVADRQVTARWVPV
jgi:hypothetical protein